MRILKSHPILRLFNSYLIDSPEPSNISYLWNFGSLLGVCLVLQIITGVTLAMHYSPNILEAFNSVEHIMRDVNNGGFIRYLHSNVASAFFFLVYLHIGRGIYYSSYKAPRTLVWLIGTITFVLMIGTGFLGYVLPYGQMSLWGATVITNLISAIPWIGKDIVEFVWGGFSVNNATLNRFFSLHYLLPFILAALVLLHLIALHERAGSSNSLGISGNYDRLPFAPYFIFKDLITIFLFIFAISVFVFFMSNLLGDSENYIMANPMQTPPAIVPEWYLLPFYAILRSIPNKLLGVIVMFSAILIILTLSATDFGKNKGLIFRPLNKIAFTFFTFNFIVLMWLGAKHVETPFIEFGQFSTIIYFLQFVFIVPVICFIENTLINNTEKGGKISEFNYRIQKNFVESGKKWFKSTTPLNIDWKYIPYNVGGATLKPLSVPYEHYTPVKYHDKWTWAVWDHESKRWVFRTPEGNPRTRNPDWIDPTTMPPEIARLWDPSATEPAYWPDDPICNQNCSILSPLERAWRRFPGPSYWVPTGPSPFSDSHPGLSPEAGLHRWPSNRTSDENARFLNYVLQDNGIWVPRSPSPVLTLVSNNPAGNNIIASLDNTTTTDNIERSTNVSKFSIAFITNPTNSSVAENRTNSNNSPILDALNNMVTGNSASNSIRNNSIGRSSGYIADNSPKNSAGTSMISSPSNVSENRLENTPEESPRARIAAILLAGLPQSPHPHEYWDSSFVPTPWSDSRAGSANSTVPYDRVSNSAANSSPTSTTNNIGNITTNSAGNTVTSNTGNPTLSELIQNKRERSSSSSDISNQRPIKKRRTSNSGRGKGSGPFGGAGGGSSATNINPSIGGNNTAAKVLEVFFGLGLLLLIITFVFSLDFTILGVLVKYIPLSLKLIFKSLYLFID